MLLNVSEHKVQQALHVARSGISPTALQTTLVAIPGIGPQPQGIHESNSHQ